jgi:hypothetical protein
MDVLKDSLCGLVVRVPGYRTEIYCASCEVRTGFIYVMYKIVTASVVQWSEFLAADPEARVRVPALPVKKK